MKKKPIKFKGVEFEEVSAKEYSNNLGVVYGLIWIGDKTYYLIQKCGDRL